jgi:hypothetical protein
VSVMGELRSVVAVPYHAGSWAALCAALKPCERMGREQWRAEIEPYVERAIAGWPDAVRVAPMSWVLLAAGGAEAGLLRLARAVVLDPAGEEVLWGDDGLVALVESPDFALITRLEAPGAGLTDQAALAIARTPNAALLAELVLFGNQLGSEGARLLARSNSLPSLRVLDLRDNDGVGPDGAAAFWEAPQSARLHRLLLEGCSCQGTALWQVYTPQRLGAVEVDIDDALREVWLRSVDRWW